MHETSIVAACLVVMALGISTQPPTLSGTGNKYRPKRGDALRLRSKDKMAHSIRG